MSKLYTADGKRRSSQAHARHTWECPCGRTVRGNGGKSSHQRACRVWLEHWLADVEEMLGRTGERALKPEWRPRWEAFRDETIARLVRHRDNARPGYHGEGELADFDPSTGRSGWDDWD